MTKTAVLMSIKPKYADMIFNGTKTIELRRVCPKVKKGDFVLVYVSGPRMALMGGFKVEGVVKASPAEFKKQWLLESGVSQNVFDTYFEGLDVAYGIQIDEIWQFAKTDLKTLRRKKGGFSPPQSYRYLREGEFTNLLPIEDC